MEGQYNRRSPAVKRLMREAQELSEPTEQYFAQPLDDNLFEWHFTIRGPAESEFDGGVFHGRIIMPPEYPMRPPSIILLTPNGRFEVFKKICLSISGHHPESWQPSWSIRTALLAIIGFMPTHGNGAIGSLDYTPEERKALSKKSCEFKCTDCGSIKNILKPVTEASEADKKEAQELASQINFQGEKEKNGETNNGTPASPAPQTSDASTSESSTATSPTTSAPAAPSLPGFPQNLFTNQQMMNRFPFPALSGQFPMPGMPPTTTSAAAQGMPQMPFMNPMFQQFQQAGAMQQGMMWPPNMQAMMPQTPPASNAPTTAEESGSTANSPAAVSTTDTPTPTSTITSAQPTPAENQPSTSSTASTSNSSTEATTSSSPTPSTSSVQASASSPLTASSSSVTTSSSSLSVTTSSSSSSVTATTSSVRQRRGVVTTPTAPQSAELNAQAQQRPESLDSIPLLFAIIAVALVIMVLAFRRFHMMKLLDLDFLFG